MAAQLKPSGERGLWKLSIVLVIPPRQGLAAVGLQGKFVWCVLMCLVKDLQATSCQCPPFMSFLNCILKYHKDGVFPKEATVQNRCK